MTAIRKLFSSVLLIFSTSLLADQAELIAYAEHQPLAAHSILLDIIQTTNGKFIAVGERGHVVISDNGSDWTQAETVPGRFTLTVITEYGNRLWAAGHDTVILSSGDGGQTWTRNYYDPELQQPIMGLHFTASGRGFAIGAYGLMLVTNDGGETWEEQMVSEEGWHLNAILDLGDGRMMIAGEAGFSYRSLDGGATWETLEMPYPGSMFGIIARANGCIVQFGLRGHIQESCDFGDSWTGPASGTLSTISAALPTADGLILVGNSGLVLIEDEAGNFTSVYHSSGVDFASVIAVGDGYLLVGEEGAHNYPEADPTGTD